MLSLFLAKADTQGVKILHDRQVFWESSSPYLLLRSRAKME